jgi:hypothetical protein
MQALHLVSIDLKQGKQYDRNLIDKPPSEFATSLILYFGGHYLPLVEVV